MRQVSLDVQTPRDPQGAVGSRQRKERAPVPPLKLETTINPSLEARSLGVIFDRKRTFARSKKRNQIRTDPRTNRQEHLGNHLQIHENALQIHRRRPHGLRSHRLALAQERRPPHTSIKNRSSPENCNESHFKSLPHYSNCMTRSRNIAGTNPLAPQKQDPADIPENDDSPRPRTPN
jgi:hypothetical protein